MPPIRRPFLQVASRLCALPLLCIPYYAQAESVSATSSPTQQESLNEKELHHLIIKSANSIKDDLVQIRDYQSARASVGRLQHHYQLITVYLNEMHKRISNNGYNLLLIKEHAKESTRLFGKISILSRELLRCDAYGSKELAELLRKFCPEEQSHAENSVVDPVGSIIQAQGLQSPASFIQAENMLTQLHNRLKKVQSMQDGMEQAQRIHDLVYALVEIDHLIKMTLTVSDTKEVDQAYEKLELIRHLGSLCHHEIMRIEEADFYGLDALRSTIHDSRQAVGNPILAPSHTGRILRENVAFTE